MVRDYQKKETWDAEWRDKGASGLFIADDGILDVLLRYAKKKDRIIEIGCGTGLITLLVSKKKFLSTTLLDYSEEALKLAKHYAVKHGVRASFVRGDARKIPLKSNSFDVVWNSGVVEHFKGEERSRVIDEMIRITKPGGFVIIFVPNKNCITYRINKSIREKLGFWTWGYEEAFTMEELLKRMRGVKVVEKGEVNYLDALFLWPVIFKVFKKLKKKFEFRDSKLPLLLGVRGFQIYAVGKKLG